MSRIIAKLLGYGLTISMFVYQGCSSGDEPRPFDCDTSDLAISVSASTDPTTCLAGDGSITVIATGGKEPYQYKVGTGVFGNSNILNNLGAGTFAITVKDKNGCTKAVSKTLILPGLDPLSASAIVVADDECLTDNGSITIVASGGTGTYEYKLGSGSFGALEVFSNVGNGSQTVSVKDAEGCTITLNVNVPRGNTGITYDGNILAIFVAKCQFSGCHPDNGNWFDYNVAKSKASLIKTNTGNGSMPKGGANAPGGALSASQKALIACWVDDGAPKN